MKRCRPYSLSWSNVSTMSAAWARPTASEYPLAIAASRSMNHVPAARGGGGHAE